MNKLTGTSLMLLAMMLLLATSCKEDDKNLVDDDIYKKDTDGDGVRDIDDKCPTIAGLIENNGCPSDASQTDTDGDGIMDDKDKCPLVKGSKEFDGCLDPATLDDDKDGVVNGEDKCPNKAGEKENDGCPYEAVEVGKIDFPKDKQSCIDIPIQVQFTAAKDGSGSFQYRYVLMDLTKTSSKKVSDWSSETTQTIASADLEKDHIYELGVEVEDTKSNQVYAYDKVRFHVRGEAVSTKTPPTAIFLTPIHSGGKAKTKIEWTNIEGLTYDVWIDGEEVKTGLTNREYLHNLKQGSHTVVIKSIHENGFSSTTSPYGFIVE